MKLEIKFEKGECFWGGTSHDGFKNPYTENSDYHADYRALCLNQTMPMFLSNKGRYFWSEKAFKVDISNGYLILEGEDIIEKKAGSSLKDAYLDAMQNHFPFDKRRLNDTFFKVAQYNTWMEYTYNQTEEGVLSYAQSIIDNGFEPGLLIIDEGWHGRYGDWRFDQYKFPHPKEMIEKLHQMGFKVMLWVVPLVCPDGRFFIEHTASIPNAHKDKDNLFLRDADGKVALVKWWNGFSAILDLRKDCDQIFLQEQLDRLINDYGVDGFKFDGGIPRMYSPTNMVNANARDDHDQFALNKAWNEFGRRYEFHEYKDSYKSGGNNSIQRLSDKFHRWDESGLLALIPDGIVAGLLGTPFICPDMIGGGDWVDTINPNVKIDNELFIRMAQISAFFPMMQFSWAPWRVLDKNDLQTVRNATDLHKSLSKEIISLVRKSEVNGEPIIRNLEYNYPNQGYAEILDEFMLGEDILIAPIVTPKTYERKVVFPKGTWQDTDCNVYNGNNTLTLPCPLDKILWFRKI